jgi:hypothetical protein
MAKQASSAIVVRTMANHIQLALREIFLVPVATKLRDELSLNRRPTCRVRNGRFVIELRSIGATSWDSEAKLRYAREVVGVARGVLSESSRSDLRRRARRAIVVEYVDESIVDGGTVREQWTCTILSAADSG